MFHGDVFHQFHCKRVLVGSNVGELEYRAELVLTWCHLIVEHSDWARQPCEASGDFIHEGTHTRVHAVEVVKVGLLARGGCAPMSMRPAATRSGR